jgi:hypothetical protein
MAYHMRIARTVTLYGIRLKDRALYCLYYALTDILPLLQPLSSLLFF